MVVAVGLTLWEPDVAVDAVQAALHDVALVAAHVKVAVWPAAIEAGAALKVTLGGVPEVPKMLSSAALVQGWPLISDKATRRTKRPVFAGKRTVCSLVLAANVPAATAVPQVAPSSLT